MKFEKENVWWIIRRFISYGIGLFLVSLSISLTVKSALGISPAASIAYVLGLMGGWSMGVYTMIVYSAFVLLQIILKGRSFEKRNLLQIPISLAFGLLIDFTNILVGFLPDASNYMVSFLYVFIALNVMGFGYVFYLPPNIIPLPSEGVMQAISYRFKMKNSTAKLIWDPLCVLVTVVVSFAFLGDIYGIGIGTFVAAFGNGLALKFYTKIFQKRLSDPFLRCPENMVGKTPAIS